MLAGRFTLMLLLSVCTVSSVKLLLKFDRAELCEEAKELILVEEMFIKSREGQNDEIFGSFVLLRTFKQFKFEVRLTRCLNKEALDTCIPFSTLKPINSCLFFNMDNTAWYSITEGLVPRMKCPAKAGRYLINNASFDASLFTAFPLTDFYWKSNVTFIVGKLSYSFCTESKFVRYIDEV